MDTFKKNDLERLLRVEATGCVSIYLPTFKSGPEVQQGPIRLKNLMKIAENHLVDLGQRSADVLDQLKPIEKLIHDAEFWKFQNDGLALFLSPIGLETYRLPIQFEPVVSVDNKFNVRPLLMHLNGNGEFYIMAISINDARVFKASKFKIEALDVENLPVNLKQALNLDKSQSTTLNRAPGFSAGTPTHGSLEFSDIEKKEISQYFRKINNALSETLKSETHPLVFAGVDALFAIYKEVNSYPHLHSECIHGNPEILTPAQLHAKAWPMVASVFAEPQISMREKFEMLNGKKSPLASIKFEEIFFAAHQSRVETLMIAKSASQWGNFDLDNLQINARNVKDINDHDLLSAMITPVILSGAEVYLLDLEDMPEAEPLAALFRY